MVENDKIDPRIIDLVRREIYWFNKLERDGYYEKYPNIRNGDSLEVISRISKIVGN